MPDDYLDSFDHSAYRGEVEQRWGAEAYARSDAWWRSTSEQQRTDWKAQVRQLNADWTAAAAAHVATDSPEAMELAQRHVKWLSGIPGTPAADPGGDLLGYVRGLADMYVADERFAANYGGVEGATFVRDSLLTYADRVAPDA